MRQLTEQDIIERATSREERARRWRIRLSIFLLVLAVAACVAAILKN